VDWFSEGEAVDVDVEVVVLEEGELVDVVEDVTVEEAVEVVEVWVCVGVTELVVEVVDVGEVPLAEVEAVELVLTFT